jgi:cell division transport system ATP-binding protein
VVYLNDVNIARLIGPWRTRATRSFGIVNQQCQLIRKRTIGDNLLLAANAGGMLRRSKSRQAVKKALGIVGLPGVETYYPAELSIGECRRVELARALINSPPLLLLDELTANLDDDNIWDLMHLLNELNTRGTTIVMATHASQYVNIMRRRVVTLVDGRVAGDVKNGKYGDIV